MRVIAALALDTQATFVLTHPFISAESSLQALIVLSKHSTRPELLLDCMLYLCLLNPLVVVLEHALLIDTVLRNWASFTDKLSMRHLWIYSINLLCSESTILGRCHLLSDRSLLVHVSCGDRTDAWDVLACSILTRVAYTWEECGDKVVTCRTASSTISTSEHRMPATWRSHLLLTVPFHWTSVGSVVAVNALVQEILRDSLIEVAAYECLGCSLPFSLWILGSVIYIVGLLIFIDLTTFNLDWSCVDEDIWDSVPLGHAWVKLLRLALGVLLFRVVGLLFQVVAIALGWVSLNVSQSVMVVNLYNIDVKHWSLHAIPSLPL